MLTARAWWFLVLVLSVLTLGVFDNRRTMTLVAFALFFWFLAEWLFLILRLRFAVPALRLEREVRDDRGTVESFWAGHTFHVRVTIRNDSTLGLPYVRITDHVPFGVELTHGQAERDGVLTAEEPLVLGYSIRCPNAGRVRFDGVAVQLADFQGFFYHAAFVSAPSLHRVLPPLADTEGRRPSVKRHNLLPSPGVHRHLRPGSGSELLDLRDYLPGDPPKTIAWKVSARRDRLITKEFESEVPLRCTFFLDTSQSVRLGPPGQNALSRLVEIAAAAAQAAAGGRDMAGLCIFDERGVTTAIRPARGARHLVGLLNRLADASGLAPATGNARVATLVPLAYALAQELYPALLRPDVNHVPGWLPFLWRVPSSNEGERVPSRLGRWVFILAGFVPLMLTASFFYAFSDFFGPLASIFLPLPEKTLTVVLFAAACSIGLLYYLFLDLAYRSAGLVLSPASRRLTRWRKRLAAVLASRYGLGPGGWGLLLEDDRQLALYLQRFLAEHHVPYPLPFYDERGRYLFASRAKVDVLAKGLLRAVGRGRDNELFVLLVDLLELSDDLEPLLRAVKVTLARHHQVLVVCPWPPGVPAPRLRRRLEPWQRAPASAPAEEPGAVGDVLPPSSLMGTVQGATLGRLHQAFGKLRQTFARLGVLVICADAGDPVRLILERLDRLRSLNTGRKR